MGATDISQAVIPLWAAISIVGGLLTSLAVVVIWVFSTFEMKADAIEKHSALAKRVDSQEITLNKVASDVSYIRGRMEPK